MSNLIVLQFTSNVIGHFLSFSHNISTKLFRDKKIYIYILIYISSRNFKFKLQRISDLLYSKYSKIEFLKLRSLKNY